MIHEITHEMIERPTNDMNDTMRDELVIFWFRRDLRINDNHGLSIALRAGAPVLPLFIFDVNILSQLEDKKDRRVNFIYQAVLKLDKELRERGGQLYVVNGDPAGVFSELISRYRVKQVYCNHDYEPYAITRDASVKKILGEKGIGFSTFKDQVIFEKKEIVKDDGSPYSIFTPYSRKWKSLLREENYRPFDSLPLAGQLIKVDQLNIPSLESLGFQPSNAIYSIPTIDDDLIKVYKENRDFPGERGTSRLGVHLRFGTLSIRELVAHAVKASETFLNELIWREFYQMILWNYPRIQRGLSFKPAYDNIEWRNNEQEFERWYTGMTGYPIVDAGMRELNSTGYMHNRVRMITASFLSKHLLIDWRWGEAYFASRLLDYELASNNGGWQWAAGTGSDAAPYFRVFNPVLQAKKFDPQEKYIRLWVPELGTSAYPSPLVDHAFAVKRCLEVYTRALKRD